MRKTKKILILLGVIVASIIFLGCRKDDTEPPIITIGESTITHVINEEVDFLENVSAIDNKTKAEDIKIEISDWGDYDRSIAGTYEITVKATDESGNSATG